MKSSQSRRGFLLAVVAGVCLFPSVSRAAVTVVGTGSDISYFVLESPNLGLRTYEVHYTFNASSQQDTYFLLTQVSLSDSSVIFGLINYGSMSAPNYILDSITHNSVEEKSPDYPSPPPTWVGWVSGGGAGYPSASPIASGSWQLSSGMSAPYRLISPGSWDALRFSDFGTVPSVSPVPEPSISLLAVLGSVLIFKRRRN